MSFKQTHENLKHPRECGPLQRGSYTRLWKEPPPLWPPRPVLRAITQLR